MTLSVIVVEDSMLQRNYAIQLCRDFGVKTIFGAEDGNEALKILRAQAVLVDIALVDLEMPGMDGVSLLRAIAQEKLAGSIVIVSSKDTSLIGSVAMMAEADGLTVLATLQKPLRTQALNETLNRYQAPVSKLASDDVLQTMTVTESDLLHAIEQRQFFMQYQPKVTLKSGLVKGVESLIRWRHPQYGVIAPIHFIPIAEQSNLMDQLTRYVLNTAFAQWSAWLAHGLKLSVAVNLSPLSLEDEKLADWILELAQNHHVDPKFLTLEITETAVIKEMAPAISTLARLRLKGFGVSIDDFGTGAATTQQLSRLPCTELKVDRSLVHGFTTKPHLHTILESTITMGNGLHLSTVAEGIETAEEWAQLRDMGCELGQGYYIARPMDAELLPQWIRSGTEHLRQRMA